MTYQKTTRAFLFFLVFFIISGAADAARSPDPGSGNGQSAQNQDSQQPGDQTADSQKQPLVQIPENVGGSLQAEATDVGEKLKSQARSLFVRKPMGWNGDTLRYAYRQLISLPSKAPVLIAEIHEQSRVLGVAGSMLVLVFILAVAYGLIGRRRVLARIQNLAGPVSQRLPEEVYPYFQVGLRSVVAALIPLLLFGAYLLIKGFIDYAAPWFLLVGSLLKLWTMGALFLSLVNGIRDYEILPIKGAAGKKLLRMLRLVILYILLGMGILWGAQSFALRQDVLALLRFIISASVVVVLFLFLLNKKSILSLLPELPYENYRKFIRSLDRFWYPIIVLTFLTGLLWTLGFRHFSTVVWKKTWAIAGVYVGFSIVYHVVIGRLQKWMTGLDPSNEEAHAFANSLKGFILYLTVIVVALIVMDLLGIMDPLRQLLSFPLFNVGQSAISMWILLKALLIVFIFLYAANMVSAYLNFKIYPSIGVEPGLAYAINTFLRYFLVLIGALVALQIVGFDLRALYVFAGAIGIGIGFAMQSLASNMIGGFAIIFGGKIRKGDWIEVSGTVGVVTDIFLRATRVRTRDNIEYIVPNDILMSTTIVNYSLSSPMIRIDVPFGVTYSADPKKVSNVVMEAAEKEPSVMVYRKPEIRFVGFGDSSIDFELLIWIDVRNTARRMARSRIYFAVFDALGAAGIEIPFPQRDLHLRSGFSGDKDPGPAPEFKKSENHEMPDQTDRSDLAEVAEQVRKKRDSGVNQPRPDVFSGAPSDKND